MTMLEQVPLPANDEVKVYKLLLRGVLEQNDDQAQGDVDMNSPA